MSHLVPPTVNLNGTSRDELVAQQRAVIKALDVLIDKMAKASPHPRDWQLAPQEYIPAKEAWRNRVLAIRALRLEVIAHATTIRYGEQPGEKSRSE
jgi:hypothetical protein